MGFTVGSGKKESETGAFLGIVVLLAVLAALVSVRPPKELELITRLMALLWRRNDFLMEVSASSALANLTLLAWMLLGSRSKRPEVSDDALQEEERSNSFVYPLIVGAVVAGAAYGLLSLCWLPGQIAIFQLRTAELRDLIETAIKVNVTLAIGLLTFEVARLSVWKGILRLFPRRVPRFPAGKNLIVLGTLHEEDPKKKVEWAVQRSKALVGNIIITGSIGSGKSAGALFSYADQVLTNFDPRPALLAVDPKGKITKEILKITDRLDLGEHVLHMRLGGDVTFNPIYQKDPLRNGGFSDITKMIRSAAVNYMGKSFDSPFWEQSASTLVKNCLIHCAATKGYYTLNDLYSSMVRAASSDEDFINELKARMADARQLTPEERSNVSFAIEYFKEYRQLDDKVRTGILATSTTFLSQFQEYQASRIFCPTEDHLTISSMDEVLDQGKILLFDITNDGLARSMGTFVKLHYEKAILRRLQQGRSIERPAVLVIDEYQDVVTTGYGTDFGDETFLAESREANAISIMATQSLSSLENSIGREKPTQVLWNGFRTKILCHSGDLATINAHRELVGKEDRPKISRTLSEHKRENLGIELGGRTSMDGASVSESVSSSPQSEYGVTAKDFARLRTFEAFLMMFDGVDTIFEKLYLKPHYLKNKRIPHSKILKQLVAGAILVVPGLATLFVSERQAVAFPSVCTVMKAGEAASCMDFQVSTCMCGFPIPRPCAHFSYYVPESFIEVMPEPRSSFMGDLPGAAAQLSTLTGATPPYGVEGEDDTQSFEAHVASVPFTMLAFASLPCGGGSPERMCFEGMSEYLESNWTTGSADLLQPQFLAWGVSPKTCLLRGAAASASGEAGSSFGPGVPACAASLAFLPKYPPSGHPACTGWGTFYPRVGVYTGPSQTTGALMVASRMKSLASEVFQTTPAGPEEFWQMIYPQSSSCFREGQNVALLDTVKNVRETGRLTSGRLTGYLFTVWSKVSCCRDLAEVPVAYAAIEAMKASCQGLGGS